MADELEKPYMLAKEQMEDIYSKIAALEAKKRLNKKQFPESDNTELKRLKRLRNARLYRQKVKLSKERQANKTKSPAVDWPKGRERTKQRRL